MDELKKRLCEIMLAQIELDTEAQTINEFVEVLDKLIVARIESARINDRHGSESTYRLTTRSD